MQRAVVEFALNDIAACDRGKSPAAMPLSETYSVPPMQQIRKEGQRAPVLPHPQIEAPRRARKAQAMVEFALALPIFLLAVYGLLEVGRLVFMYAAVTSASREGARYASAWGIVDSVGHQQYQNCAGIRSAARQVGFLLNLSGTTNTNIKIYFDDETPVQTPPVSLHEYCTTTGLAIDTGIGPGSTYPVNTGDRVVVTVTATYSPILRFFLPLTQQTITTTTSRTVTGQIDLAPPPP